jgi:hypothetical protein
LSPENTGAQSRLIVTFRSSHAALRAERTLMERGACVELIPVPREIASECGFCLLTPPLPGGTFPEVFAGIESWPDCEGRWLVHEWSVPGRYRKERSYEPIV